MGDDINRIDEQLKNTQLTEETNVENNNNNNNEQENTNKNNTNNNNNDTANTDNSNNAAVNANDATNNANNAAANANNANNGANPPPEDKSTTINISELENLPQMVASIKSEDFAAQLEATTKIRKLLSIDTNPPIETIINAGVVPIFVKFLADDTHQQLQYEAAWSLTNIASGSSEHTRVVIDNGAVPIFVKLLTSQNDDTREQALWGLGNIAGDSPACRDQVLNAGVLPPLLDQLHATSKLSILRNATWTLSNLCRGKPQPDFSLIRSALPMLAKLLYHEDEEVLTDACWTLSYLSDGGHERIHAVLEAGVGRRVVELLTYPSFRVQTPALRTVGNIVTGDDLQTQLVLNLGVLGSLHTLMRSTKKGIRKEACWTISNITAGNRSQIQAVIDAGILPILIELLRDGDHDLKKEAAWTIYNATSGGSPTQIDLIVQSGCIEPLCNLLEVGDVRILNVTLETLENILRIGGQGAPAGSNLYTQCIEDASGLDKIESLQNHASQEVYEKAYKLLSTYYECDEHA